MIIYDIINFHIDMFFFIETYSNILFESQTVDFFNVFSITFEMLLVARTALHS